MTSFRDLIADGRPHVFDGAMGTMLYGRGVYINRSYDEVNLREAEAVRDIHRAYVRAGAEILQTNSYSANRVKLARFGLEKELHAINARAAEIARGVAAGSEVLVAGSIGPLGLRIEPYGPTSVEEAREYFREQAEALLAGGVDLFVLETFADLMEIQQAILAIRSLGDHAVVAQMTIGEDGRTPYGTEPPLFAARLAQWGADVVGMNCSIGPSIMLPAIEKMARVTDHPLSAQPNAGLPREVDGRQMYLASPEYIGKYAARMIRKGARFVGGCCGTTPEHIARVADAVRAVAPRAVHVAAARPAHEQAGVQPVPLAERSRWGAKLARGSFLTTVEIVPPRGADAEAMLQGVRLLEQAGIDGVNVPDGPRAQSRMGALATAVLIQQCCGIEAVLHYACRDRNLLGMLSDLLGAQALGLRNLLLVTGDPPKMGPYPDATAVFDIDSIGLTNLVRNLNRGLDPGGNGFGAPTSFVIGVGVNPVAVDFEHEISRFRWKVEAGAEYAITQPIFDVAQLFALLERIEKEGLRIPIVAGIWPLVSARNAEFLANEVPGVVIPEAVLKRMRRASEHGKDAGIAEGIAIAHEMLAAAYPHLQGVQVSAPFGRVELALRVFEAVPGWATAEGVNG